MKQNLIKSILKEYLNNAIENKFVFSFVLLAFLFFLWESSLFGEPSIAMVIIITLIVFIFGAKLMKVHLAGERLNLLTRHCLDILFP